MKTKRICMAALISSTAFSIGAVNAVGEPITIAQVKHEGPVDFSKEILPILRRNCLACHNATDAESDLVLENPETILQGGAEGPAVVAGKSGESLLLKLAAHQDDPVMPPEDNEVRAKNLTSQELGLIKLWIDEGAKGTVNGGGEVVFEKLPSGVNPIYAIAISADGQYVAAGRANQIFIYHVPSKREIGRLTDPELLKMGIYQNPGVAHLDLVQSLAFSPDNLMLASGGYRNVKIWQRARNAKLAELKGLEGPAQCVSLSPDAKLAAFGEANGKIKIFDLGTGNVVKTLEGHTAAVSGVAFNGDGSQLVSGSQDKTFRLWNVADGKQLAEPIETPAPVNAVAFVTGGKEIATGNADNTIRIWGLPGAAPAEKAEGAEAAEPPKPLREIKGHTQPVTSLATIGAEGAQLLSGSLDATARQWNVADGKMIRQLAHGGPVVAVAVRSDGARFASASANNTARLWNAADGKQLAELKGDFRAKIKVEDLTRAVALAKRKLDLDKKDLEAAKKRKTDEEANQKKAQEAKTKAEADFKAKDEAAKKPVADKEAADKDLEAKNAALAKADETKKANDAAATAAAEALKKAQADLTAKNTAATNAANVAKQAADKLKAAQDAANKDKENKDLAAALKAAETAAADAETKKKAADEAKVAADKVVADADGKKKAADEGKKVSDAAFTKATNEQKASDANVKKLTPPAQKATDEKIAAERALKAAERSVQRAMESVKKATDAIPGVEAVVKAAEEHEKQVTADLAAANTAVTEAEKPLKSIAFSVDGTTLVTAGDNQVVYTWDSETGAAIDSFVGQGAAHTALGFTSDGNVLSAAGNNTIVIWDTNPEWKLVRTIGNAKMSEEIVDRVTSLDFSPDSKLLATGSGEPSRSGELKIWNVADGALVREIKEPHSDTIFGLEFSPDGKFIATCAADRFAKMFDVETGKFLKSFEGHTHHVLDVSWSDDGRRLYTAGADKLCKIWNARTGDQITSRATGFGKEVTSIRAVGVNFVISCGDKNVYIRRGSDGNNVRTFSGNADFVYSAGASANGKLIVAGGQDSIVRIWQDSGQVFATFEPPKPDQTASLDSGD